MVIHHDKMAYGKIKPLQDELDQFRLTAMAKKLSAAEAEAEEEEETEAEAEAEAEKSAKLRTSAERKKGSCGTCTEEQR